MNTYDPADYILYVSMDGRHRPVVSAPPADVVDNRLPQGYANASPKTRLRRAVAARPSVDSGGPVRLRRADGRP